MSKPLTAPPYPLPSAPPAPALSAAHPVFGHLLEFRKDRLALQLRMAREERDIARLRFGFFPIVIVTSPTLAHEALTTKSASMIKAPGLSVFLRPLLGDGLLTSERSVHTKQRKLLAPVFAHKRVASYAAEMGVRTERFAKSLQDGAVVDVSEAMMRLTLEIVGKALFDTEVAEHANEVSESVTTVMEGVVSQLNALVPMPPFMPTATNRRNRRAIEKLDAIVYGIIKERRVQGGDRGDLLSMLLETRDEAGGAMTDKQIRDEAMTLFLAGHETTANALSWTLYLLAKNPEVRARLEAEVDALGHTPSYEDLEKLPYTLAVFKEAMRLYPPAYVLGRRVTDDALVIGKNAIKTGTIVLVNVLGIHRRADLFPEPLRFDPEHFLGDAEKKLPRGAYLPFGGGPRVCIGNHFALMEGHVLLAALLARTRFDVVSANEPEMEPLVTLRPKGGIQMKVSVRELS